MNSSAGPIAHRIVGRTCMQFLKCEQSYLRTLAFISFTRAVQETRKLFNYSERVLLPPITIEPRIFLVFCLFLRLFSLICFYKNLSWSFFPFHSRIRSHFAEFLKWLEKT